MYTEHRDCFFLCYANIEPQAPAKIGKNLALTFLSSPDKLPKLTGKTGHTV